MLYLLLFATGGVIGSFLNACIYRLPRRISMVFPPSACPRCKHRLGALDLVPVLSYLCLRGRCRYCHGAIPTRYLIVELVAGVWLPVSWRMTREVASFLWLSVNGLLLLLAGLIDKETGLIPNKITYGGAAFGLAYYGLKQFDMLPPALLGGLVGFGTILFIRLIYPKSIGMGDAKLLGYIGIITGPGQALLVLFLAAVFGLISNIHLFVRRGKQALTTRVPFGPFIAVAGWIVFLWGDTLIVWWANLFV